MNLKKTLITSFGAATVGAGMAGKKGLEKGMSLGIKIGMAAGVAVGILGTTIFMAGKNKIEEKVELDTEELE